MELTQIMQLLGLLLGGIGLFLLAVRMITSGLTIAAGEALRDILATSTQTLPRGILTGLGITAIVQSSSAVTVATIGFVNAGMLNLFQALGVVYGANIGTTMTGWLVAAVGFKIKVEAFALPLIGIGMLLRLTGAAQRRGAIGEVLAGFGLFFIGIDVLKNAFEGMAASIDLNALAPEGALAVLLYVWIGFLMTMLMQSSSAAIALILTAATGGVLPLASAAAMVVGANVGTTSTAALAVIGATPNAKRVASAHIVFNLLTGLVALLILPAMLWLIHQLGQTLGLDAHPAVSLALFHSAFNILGVLLLWPITRPLTHFLEHRFVSLEETAGRAQYLDKTVMVTPVLALHALTLEISRLGGMARELAREALNWERVDRDKLDQGLAAIQQLNLAVGDFVSRFERASLPATVTELLPLSLRAANYFNTVADLATDFSKECASISRLTDEAVASRLEKYRRAILNLLSQMDDPATEYNIQAFAQQLEKLEAEYQQVKREILEAGAMARIRVAGMSALLEEISRLRRLCEQIVKGMKDLAEVVNAEVIAGELIQQAEAMTSASRDDDAPLETESAHQHGEQLAQTVGHDLDGDGGEHQTEQAVEDIEPDGSEQTPDGAGKA